MIYPQTDYIIDNFVGSNNANCPILNYYIEPIVGGTSNDYSVVSKTYEMDKKTKKYKVKINTTYVEMKSTYKDPKITVHVPNFNASNLRND